VICLRREFSYFAIFALVVARLDRFDGNGRSTLFGTGSEKRHPSHFNSFSKQLVVSVPRRRSTGAGDKVPMRSLPNNETLQSVFVATQRTHGSPLLRRADPHMRASLEAFPVDTIWELNTLWDVGICGV